MVGDKKRGNKASFNESNGFLSLQLDLRMELWLTNKATICVLVPGWVITRVVLQIDGSRSGTILKLVSCRLLARPPLTLGPAWQV
jgi:hypothetical protein